MNVIWILYVLIVSPYRYLPVDDKIVEILNMILVVATFLPVPRMWTHLETRSALNPDMSGSRYDLDQSYLIVLSRLTMTNSIHFLEFKSIRTSKSIRNTWQKSHDQSNHVFLIIRIKLFRPQVLNNNRSIKITPTK